MEGRRMAGSGHDFVITSSILSGPSVRRSSAVRDFGLVPLARRGRRAHPSSACQTNVNEHVQRHETAASRLRETFVIPPFLPWQKAATSLRTCRRHHPSAGPNRRDCRRRRAAKQGSRLQLPVRQRKLHRQGSAQTFIS